MNFIEEAKAEAVKAYKKLTDLNSNIKLKLLEKYMRKSL